MVNVTKISPPPPRNKSPPFKQMTYTHLHKSHHYTQPWRRGYYAALDIGSTKIICLIGKGKPNGALHVEGYGWCQSAGIHNGAITDLRLAEAAIRYAIAEAEIMAERSIERIIVNLPCGHPVSRVFNIPFRVGKRVVTDTILQRVAIAARQQATTKSRKIIHILPINFIVDDTECVLDPRGYLCDNLNARIHIIDAADTPLTNLQTLLARIDLKVEGFVVSPLASSFSVLDVDEYTLDTTVIDIGGDTTSFALFDEGRVLHTGFINVGGTHITHDIAHRLNTSTLNEAERIKTLFGSVELTTPIEHDMISVELRDNHIPHMEHVSRSQLCHIIRPRIEEIFKQVREQLSNAGFTIDTRKRFVITGGGSLLDNISSVAEQNLTSYGFNESNPNTSCTVRLGHPKHVSGVPYSNTASFSTSIGLLKWTMSTNSPFGSIKYRKPQPTSLLQKIVSVLRKDL